MLEPAITDWFETRALDWFGEVPGVDTVIDGFYGQVCIVRLASGERRVVKRFRIAGFAPHEARAMQALRAATPAAIAVPQLLHFETAAEHGWDAFVMDHVAGVNATETPAESADALAADIVALQRHWHAQTATAFEGLDGCRFPSFAASYHAYLAARRRFLEKADGFDTALKARLLATLAHVDTLLAPIADDPPAFIHDDGHAGNYLVDPHTWRLVAVIDPAGARFAHRELDLFHLPDARSDFRLLERYLETEPPAPLWPARRWLFSLWDDIKHAEFTGWRDDAWFERKLAAFHDELEQP
ncbi:phosphotransferase [Jeongeupia chitinilytica]|uniref:Aminoglycoside phosphotransferase domain-containing protein n=1 Tax=Jeongeupia chitinilytica TaxID=1041641 RepID=A0ABQ3H0Q6_9NEIS|nr:phosphotransferase [Jeongeupia chitinilytica]GHD64501.1 hypothetical protein GCM10007350_23800 [Jeongeupia chitinilytica]